MKEVSINGVAYLPASVLAKDFRYTTDYIGQLCRAKKVDAQLVGRSWYVNPLSLKAHKETRYIAKLADENIVNEENKITISRLEVHPVVAKNTVKMTVSPEVNFAKRINWKPLKYEVDEGDLLPQFGQNKTRKINVDLADSTTVAIKTTSKPIILEPEPLAEVSLRGKIALTAMDDVFEEQEEDDFEPADIPMPHNSVAFNKKPEAIHHLPLPTRVNSPSDRANRPHFKKPAKSKAAVIVSPYTPASIQIASEESPEFRPVEITFYTTAAILALCLILIFFTENQLQADATSYHWGIDFSTQSLTALVSLFSF